MSIIGPKLVLLPGMDGTGELFAAFVEALPKSFATETVQYPSDPRLSSTDLIQFLQSSISSSAPFVLIAESFSSPLAIEWAATNPPNLKGLVICAGFVTSPVRGWLRSVCSFLSPICFLIPLPKFAIRLLLVGHDAQPSLVNVVRETISSVSAGVLSARLRSVLICDARSELSQLTIPVMFLHAMKDRLVGMDRLKEMQRIRPDAATEVIAGPHLLFQREPEKAAEAVAMFALQC
jgi:pimeloyl-[acyl-carrier protein] methyl ester esterase